MGKEGDQVANAKLRKVLRLEENGPRLIQEFAAFGAKKRAWIEEMLLCMVFDMDHAFHLQCS